MQDASLLTAKLAELDAAEGRDSLFKTTMGLFCAVMRNICAFTTCGGLRMMLLSISLEKDSHADH